MKISVAQIQPIKGDIAANIDSHKKLIQLAIANNADAIFFPELSITGYEPSLAKELAINQDDTRFNAFQEISNHNKITIAIGMPTKAPAGVHISMLIFQPGMPRQTYSKQQLHADEIPYFTHGEKQIIVTVNNIKIAPAICYESLQANHSAIANKMGAKIYVASVAKSQNGIDQAMLHYPAIAKKYAMPVLLTNCVGHCDNFKTVGKSAVWSKQGNILAQLDDKHQGILIFNTETEEVVELIL